jgi:excisionase family DNA binding protein
MVTPSVDSLLTSAPGGATKRFLTPADLAAELSVSLRTAYRVAEEIGATRIGKLVRISREAFEAWLAQQNPSSRRTPLLLRMGSRPAHREQRPQVDGVPNAGRRNRLAPPIPQSRSGSGR